MSDLKFTMLAMVGNCGGVPKLVLKDGLPHLIP